MAYTAQRVVFPFAAALPAAAALWALSTKITDDIDPARQKAALTAEQLFQGNYANQFAERIQRSGYNAKVAPYDLQQAALDIANAWADAEHQQQLYLYFAMVQHKKDSQSFLDSVGNWLTGDHTNYGQQPARPEVSGPPGFAPTPVPQAQVPGETPPSIG